MYPIRQLQDWSFICLCLLAGCAMYVICASWHKLSLPISQAVTWERIDKIPTTACDRCGWSSDGYYWLLYPNGDLVVYGDPKNYAIGQKPPIWRKKHR
jgi:hypothetical protein